MYGKGKREVKRREGMRELIESLAHHLQAECVSRYLQKVVWKLYSTISGKIYIGNRKRHIKSLLTRNNSRKQTIQKTKYN